MYLGDDSSASIIRRDRVKLKLKDGRIITLHGMIHIPNLARKEFGMELCKKYWEAPSSMNVTSLLCLREEIK